MTVLVRPYIADDVPAMRNIWNSVVDAGKAFPQIDPLTEETAIEFFAQQDACGVALDNERVVGLYILHPNNIGRCSGVANASYAVMEGLRGKGIGRALVSDSLLRAAELGFTGLQFNAVVASNTGAMHLYEGLGFYRVGMIPSGFLNKEGLREDMFIYYHPCNSTADGQIMNVVDVVALEQRIAAEGISLRVLMERAGSAIAGKSLEVLRRTRFALSNERAREVAESASVPQVIVLAGTGNNGGDGWVAARLLSDAGVKVTLVTPKAAEEIVAEPARSAALEVDERVEVLVSPTVDMLEDRLTYTDLVIDALLGTGFSHDEIRQPMAQWVELTNTVRLTRSLSGRPLLVVSADVPSGLNAQTGAFAQPCVHADATVTMLAYKPGLLAASALPFIGAISLAPLDV